MSPYTAAEKTQKALIDAAGELFALHGYDRVTTRAIAELSGENQGGIHYHFGGKEGLLDAAVESAIQCSWTIEELERLVRVELPSGDSPEHYASIVVRMMDLMIESIFSTDRPWWGMTLLFRVLTDAGDIGRKFVDSLMRPHLELTAEIARAIQPEMTEEESQLWAVACTAQVKHFAMMRQAMLHFLNTDEYTDQQVAAIRKTILKNTLGGLELPLPVELRVGQ